MSKSKKILGLFVAFVILFAAVFYGISSIQTLVKAESVVSMEEVDEYLRNNGYSEDFINGIGEQTKLHLYNQSAVFVDETIYPQATTRSQLPQNWNGFSDTLTVSEITSEPNRPKLILTYRWTWATGLRVENDGIAISWGDDFTARRESALFEIYGISRLKNEYCHIPYIDIPEYNVNQTFQTIQGYNAVTTYAPNLGVGLRFSIDYDTTTRRYYQSGTYGDYGIDPDLFHGAYSITIEKVKTHGNINSAMACYFHWVHDVNIEFEFSFSLVPPSINLSVSASQETYFEKSIDKSIEFEYHV